MEIPHKELQSFITGAAQIKKGLPPVEKWEPDFCGDIDMLIKRDGSWFYMGTPIVRKELVRLFSTILRKDKDGKTYLVTPGEKVGITVEDAPFLAVEMSCQGTGKEQILTFRSNVNDVIIAGHENSLRFEIDNENEGLKPYILVRGRLEALLTRAITLDLIALGQEVVLNGKSYFVIYSQGVLFPIMPVDELL
ncbi:MAG: DUF1285 domain-containing protein [Methylococcales bacterium]